MKKYDRKDPRLTEQFENVNWIENSGLSEDELNVKCQELSSSLIGRPKSIIKAKTYELILTKGRIAIDEADIFQDKISGKGIINKQRESWMSNIIEKYLKEESKSIADAMYKYGAYRGDADFGHTSPNTMLLLEIGFPGLLLRIENALRREGLSDKQKCFYTSCKITLSAIITFINRLANEVENINRKNSEALRSIANGAPQNIYEAMQLIIIYFFVHEFIGGTRVRTLGRLDVMLYPFYKKDLDEGRFTKEDISEMLKFFFGKFYAVRDIYGTPFCIAGLDENGDEVTNDLTYLIVKSYNSIDINSPKIHIRVSEKTPKELIKLVLSCIREGKSSFVFLGDRRVVRSLMSVGIEEKDALNYVPIGCYEPAVWGVEVGCTGNGGVNLAKAIELVITRGRDLSSDSFIGVDTGEINTYEDFLCAIKKQIKYMAEKSMNYISSIERHYGEMNPDPILSVMYDRCVENGIDAYEGGAKYNNSSLYFYCIATLVDSVAAVKRLVFDEKRVSYADFCEILKSNWQGSEKLRLICRNLPEKYGNGNRTADEITKDIAEFCASLVNGRQNGRGGVFKASCFSIDRCFYLGTRTMATPDGRNVGDPLAKNLCATVGSDRNGITALINSVTVFDHALFPNGSVLDIVLHPSAVSGEDGLEAFYGILMTYINRGGMAMHGNVFDPEVLRAAQKYPEKYSNLQVRVCGWNAYFVNLSKIEQDSFIRHSEVAY